ncbi:hypothetical protein AX16_007188 [Volvariella volvacea WC 439]|nr:hypothetical protein AX16_007188 [Volvariella volvacea WC 439]
MSGNGTRTRPSDARRRDVAQKSSLSSFLMALSIGIALAAITFLPSFLREYHDQGSSGDSELVSRTIPVDPSVVAEAITMNAAHATTYPLVAVFVGGTSGIGRGMLETFAARMSNSSTASQIFVVGRNAQAAGEIEQNLKTLDPNVPAFKFISADLTLMRNVRKVSAEILRTTPKINFLIMTPGIMSMNKRIDTDEGIDVKLALHYYSRWAFIHHLLPALQTAKKSGEDAKVLSVLGAGWGGAIDVKNLGLEKDYHASKAGLQMPTYTDLMMEEYAAQNPEISFIHANPGLVQTPLIERSDYFIIRMTSPLIKLFLKFFATPVDKCAKYMWAGIYRSGGGAHRIGSDGQNLGGSNYHGNEEQRKLVWDHTVQKVLGQ